MEDLFKSLAVAFILSGIFLILGMAIGVKSGVELGVDRATKAFQLQSALYGTAELNKDGQYVYLKAEDIIRRIK